MRAVRISVGGFLNTAIPACGNIAKKSFGRETSLGLARFH
jgi:hypothetical protein